MKKITVFLFCGIILSSSVFAENHESCQTVFELFQVCKQAGILTSVKDTISNNSLKVYDELIVSDKELTSIKPNAFKNITIKVLVLGFADTALNISADSFNGLPLLSDLFIRSGVLPLTENIFQALKSMKNLGLVIDGSKNRILGDNINLPNLTSLVIHNSNLKEISGETFSRNLPPLFELALLNNSIASIHSKSFAPLRFLRNLVIEMNDNLTDIQPGTFGTLSQLRFLSLANNKLTRVTRDIFNDLTNLEYLNLNDNKIMDIEIGCFSSRHIKELSLVNNQLTVIKKGTFHGLSISRLNLSNNKIIRIENGAFENTSIDQLIISNNINITIDKSAWGLPEMTKVSTIIDSKKI